MFEWALYMIWNKDMKTYTKRIERLCSRLSLLLLSLSRARVTLNMLPNLFGISLFTFWSTSGCATMKSRHHISVSRDHISVMRPVNT